MEEIDYYFIALRLKIILKKYNLNFISNNRLLYSNNPHNTLKILYHRKR